MLTIYWCPHHVLKATTHMNLIDLIQFWVELGAGLALEVQNWVGSGQIGLKWIKVLVQHKIILDNPEWTQFSGQGGSSISNMRSIWVVCALRVKTFGPVGQFHTKRFNCSETPSLSDWTSEQSIHLRKSQNSWQEHSKSPTLSYRWIKFKKKITFFSYKHQLSRVQSDQAKN